jgi:hypothetical protein
VNFAELTKVLQTSISPVALISGVGLLLLSMTNRLGRTIDRARLLAREARSGTPDERERAVVQIRIIYQRARQLRLAIEFASMSIFCSCCIIVLIPIIYVAEAGMQGAVIFLFIVSLFFLILALALFIRDVLLSLKALKLDIEDWL